MTEQSVSKKAIKATIGTFCYFATDAKTKRRLFRAANMIDSSRLVLHKEDSFAYHFVDIPEKEEHILKHESTVEFALDDAGLADFAYEILSAKGFRNLLQYISFGDIKALRYSESKSPFGKKIFIHELPSGAEYSFGKNGSRFGLNSESIIEHARSRVPASSLIKDCNL